MKNWKNKKKLIKIRVPNFCTFPGKNSKIAEKSMYYSCTFSVFRGIEK